MEDLLGLILYGIFEILAEAFFDVLCEAIFAFITRIFRRAFAVPGPERRTLSVLLYFTLGITSGIASLFLFPHHLVRPSRFHGVSLLLSPLATGFIMSQIGMLLRRRGKTPVQIESFT